MCHASNHYDFDSYGSQKYYTEFSFYSQLHRLCILHIYFVVVVFLFLMKNLHQSALILWVNNFRSRFQVRVVFFKGICTFKGQKRPVRQLYSANNWDYNQFGISIWTNTDFQYVWSVGSLYIHGIFNENQSKCFQIE